MDSDDWVKLDEVGYHTESEDGTSVPYAAAAGHMVLFYAWAIDRGLVPDELPAEWIGAGDTVMDDGRTALEHFEADHRRMVVGVRGRTPESLVEVRGWVGDGMFSTHFTAEAAPFAASCYMTYLGDYGGLVGSPEPVEATWDRFDLVAPYLDDLYAEHPGGGCV